MNLMSLNAFDIFFVILGCYFIIRGCFRGLAGEIITLAGFLAAMYISFKFSAKCGAVLAGLADINPSAAKFLAIIIVWMLITLLVSMLRMTIKKMLAVARLSWFDRLLGLFSGLLKTTLVVYVVLIGGLLLVPVLNPTWMTESSILRYAGRQWPEVRKILMDFDIFPNVEDLPDGTLEQILRPYRMGVSGPEGYEPPRRSERS